MFKTSIHSKTSKPQCCTFKSGVSCSSGLKAKHREQHLGGAGAARGRHPGRARRGGGGAAATRAAPRSCGAERAPRTAHGPVAVPEAARPMARGGVGARDA